MVVARARAASKLAALFLLAKDPMRVLLSVLQPPRRVLASVLQPSASEEIGKEALVGGDGSGVTGGGLAGLMVRETRFARRRMEPAACCEDAGLDGVDSSFTVLVEFERGRFSMGITSDIGRPGRTGTEREDEGDNSLSETSLVGAR